MKKKILSIGLALSSVLNIPFAVSAENAFPPQRPEVGVMKVVVGENSSEMVVGLRTNGTINFRKPQYQGVNLLGENSKAIMHSLNNVVDIACTDYEFAVLKSDGTVYTSEHDDNEYTSEPFSEANSWTNVVSIACGLNHLVGLKADGTVVATGDNLNGQCDVLGWNNVSKIYAHGNTTIAIKEDGTLLATGTIGNFSELRKLTNVNDVFWLENDDFAALLEDGTITAKKESYIKNGELVEDDGEKTELNIDAIIRMLGCTQKIVSFQTVDNGRFDIRKYRFLDEDGNLYSLTNDTTSLYWSRWELEKLEENIVDFVISHINYYALDENGQILSDKAAFTSEDWILTTNITYNGSKVTADVPPYISEGRTLAPIRAILEALGMTVSWDPATQTATAVKADITISVTINSNVAYVNGTPHTLDVPATITNSRTFVPVRFFAEALDMNVEWDGYTKTVRITD